MISRKTDEIITLIMISIFFAIIVFLMNVQNANGDDKILKKCYEQLKVSNELLIKMKEENQTLKAEIKDLKSRLEKDSLLLQQSQKQLKVSNELIQSLKEKNGALKYLNSKKEQEIKNLKFHWMYGGVLSYPIGGIFTIGYDLGKFGIISNMGFVKNPFVSLGLYFKK